MPLVALIVVQGVDRARREMADTRRQLAATASSAAAPDQNILGSAEQILRALANMSDVRDASRDCNADLAEALHGLSFFTNITRLDANGNIVCAALPASIGRNAREQPVWQEARAGTGFVVSGEMTSPITHQRNIVGILPLRDGTGTFQGAIAIGVDLRWLEYVEQKNRLPAGSVVALFDRHGHIMTASRAGVAQALFGGPANWSVTSGATGSGRDREGHTWMFSTAPVVDDTVFVGFAMREWNLFAPTYVNVSADFIVPLLLILFTWFIIWIVSERQLTRWIVYLRRISEAYRAGHYAIRPSFGDAPREFRLLGTAMSDMAEAIQERDKSLREAVAQKTLLVREVHHRVKNNLQIVMSLLSLQAGRLRDPGAQDALKQARARINALALVHRILYEIEDQNTVDLKRLVTDLAEQTSEGLGGERHDIRMTVEAVRRMAPADVAVPVALFMVEAVTNAYKHAFPPGEAGGTIRVSLEPADGGVLRLKVEDDGVGFAAPAMEISIGSQLIRTFGQQLRGTASVTSGTGGGTVAEIVFPDPEAADAQGAHAPPANG